MTPLIGMLGTTELILVLVIVVVVFGVGKLPQVGRQLGEGIKNFKSEMGSDEEPPAELDDQPVTPRDVTDE
jgi:sec-independent protein translocase protein TatA